MKENKNKQKEEILEDFSFEKEDCHEEGCCHCECHSEGECEGECEGQCECQQHDCHAQDEEKQHKCCQHGQTHGQAEEYLAMAQRLQADFENYRKHVAEQLDKERTAGALNVIEVFLPCLDTFKEAKKSIVDEGVLAGVNMIENKILEALKSLNVEKIEAVGQKYDPHLHNVIAVMPNPEKEDDIILEEYQAGWTMNGKVIRYSKVIVNKNC